MSWSIAYTAPGMAPDSLPEPIAVAALVAGSLTRLGVLYVIGDSFASSVHGEPRSTNDIDMVADLHQGDIDGFIATIGDECYISRDAVVEAVNSGGAFNVIHVPTAVKVDIFVAGSDAFDRERLTRRIPVTFSEDEDSISLFIDNAEDTILPKLEWYRRGERRPSVSGVTWRPSSTLRRRDSISRIYTVGHRASASKICWRVRWESRTDDSAAAVSRWPLAGFCCTFVAVTAPPPSLATALADRYRLERELGAGGMATVYLAEDIRHQRKVAVKVLHPELSAVLGPERFLKEITLTASFSTRTSCRCSTAAARRHSSTT